MSGTPPAARPWPELPYEEFAPTMHLLHMGMQMVGKLTLLKPFEPQWANVVLGLTSRGLTTGPIPWKGGTFTVDADFRAHELGVSTSWGATGGFAFAPMSVAVWHDRFFSALASAGVSATINEKPQEVADPVPFSEDTAPRPYAAALVEAWFQVLQSSAGVMQRYRACFTAKTPPIGFMWGTFDLRDVRLGGTPVPPAGANAGFIRRNAMNEDQVEAGWWPGGPGYPKAAYYSFTHPQPAGIETVDPRPDAARWDADLGEFLLDYDDVRAAADPEAALLAFLYSTYIAGAEKAGWDPAWICPGRPEPASEGEAE
jgi:hypothetical protein